jgi:hypothetical protein
MKYNDLFESAIDEYSYENVLSGVNYIISYARNPNPPIDDQQKKIITSIDIEKTLIE